MVFYLLIDDEEKRKGRGTEVLSVWKAEKMRFMESKRKCFLITQMVQTRPTLGNQNLPLFIFPLF